MGTYPEPEGGRVEGRRGPATAPRPLPITVGRSIGNKGLFLDRPPGHAVTDIGKATEGRQRTSQPGPHRDATPAILATLGVQTNPDQFNPVASPREPGDGRYSRFEEQGGLYTSALKPWTRVAKVFLAALSFGVRRFIRQKPEPSLREEIRKENMRRIVKGYYR
jgi:hypothetical protein